MPQANNVTSVKYGNNVVERMPPYSIEAEEAVLGSMLINPEAVERVRRILVDRNFYIARNAWVFAAMVAMRERQEPIDLVTITRELQARGQLDELGGPAYISQLMNVPTALHAEGYARIVKRLSVRRGMLEILSDGAQAAWDESGDEIAVLCDLGNRLSMLRLATMAQLSNENAIMSWSDILHTEWPTPTWIVPEMMTTGLGWLSGKPKTGKSWMALQLACAKATGGRIFNLAISPGRVLYCALEDTPRRIKDRALKQRWPANVAVDWMFNAEFEREIGNIAQGGADKLAYWIVKQNYKLVIIDTFNRAIGKYFKSGEINDSSVVGRSIDRLQVIGLENDASILTLDHHGKAVSNEGGDPVSDMLGSIAKGGTADFSWSLYRERGKSGARLQITGRDVEEKDLLLNWDGEIGTWQYEGDGSTMRMSLRREEILDFLKRNGRSMIQTVADGTGQPKSHTSERLKALVGSGLVTRIEEGANVWFVAVE